MQFTDPYQEIKEILSQYKPSEEPLPQESSEKTNPISERFKQLNQQKNNQESTLQMATRRGLQNTARATEAIVGMPGNLKKAYTQSMDYLGSLIDSMTPEGFPKQADIRKHEEELFGRNEKGSWKDIIFNPDSENLRENVTKPIAEYFTGDKEYLEPQGKLEKETGELTSDIASFFTPGTGQMRLATRIGAPVAGNLAKLGAKFLGADDALAEKAKLGVMLATTLSMQSNPAQFARDRIRQGKEMIPENATIFNQNLNDRLEILTNRLNRGLNVPSKSKARQGINDLAEQADAQGRIPFRNLMDARDNVNEWIAEAGGWDVPVAVRDQTLRNLNEFKRAIIQTIDENMAARFPVAGELYRTGYEAAAVTHQSNAISNFIERNFGKRASSIGAKLLFPAMGGVGAVLPKTAAVGAGLYPIYKSGQVLYRVANSPTLARYYTEVITHSLAGNGPAMVKSLSKFDKKMKEEEDKDAKKGKLSIEDFRQRMQSRIKKKD